MERYAQQWIDNLLDGASRFGGADVRAMLTGAGVAAGSRVVDYGCGPGYFTLIAAELVGAAGKVYAVDLEPRMVDLVRRRSAAAGFGNCEAVLSDGSRAPVADGAADVVLCVQIMHYAETRAGRVAVARDVHRLLKPGGRALIIQWQPKHGATGITYANLASVVRSAGLAPEDPRHLTDEIYLTVAHKPARSA